MQNLKEIENNIKIEKKLNPLFTETILILADVFF